MPFVAIREDTRRKVDITDYESPKVALGGVSFVCRDCAAPMVIRSGDFVSPHFAHKPGYEDRPCWFRRVAESEAHREAKRRIAAALTNSDFFKGGRVEIEYPIDTEAGRRYIDVYMELPDGRRYAHEAQISGQGIAEFAERSQAYRSQGLEPVWWLGGPARTRENIVWVKQHCAWLGELDITYQEHVIIDERDGSDGATSIGSGSVGRGRYQPARA